MTARVDPIGRLRGQVVVVTGASRGLDEAIAVRLAMDGAPVIATARTANEGESSYPGTLSPVVERITTASGSADYI